MMILNPGRQRVGDFYNSGISRLQIHLAVTKGDRNNHQQIIGCIERDGTVTNTSRQHVSTITEQISESSRPTDLQFELGRGHAS